MSKPCFRSTADFFFFFSQIVFSRHTRRKKEKTQITTSKIKKKPTTIATSSSRETGARGDFFGPSDKHLDHTIEMVNKEKICIKKTFSTITSMLHQNVCLSDFLLLFDILQHFAIQLLAPLSSPLRIILLKTIPVTLSSSPKALLLKECSKNALGGFMRNP